MKKILIAYNAMEIGGSTTSLLSILNRLDYQKFDVDLLLNYNTGVLQDMIPEKVHVLPPVRLYTNRKEEYIHRLLSPHYLWHYLISRRIVKKTGLSIRGAQYREWKDIDFQRKLAKNYDVAIAFLEGDRCKYVARHVKASRKIAWIHINYEDAGMDPKYDIDTMEQFNKIVLVSKDCKKAFDRLFPSLTNRTCIIENILTREYIIGRASEEKAIVLDNAYINLITVCRISFNSKGLDRALEAFRRLKNEGMVDKIKWYVVGDGGDYNEMVKRISNYQLENIIIMLGSKKNPYPLLKNMTMFFLPSRWEGKPMAVTEAFMMGLPIFATDYSSAREQIRDGIDGIIVENSAEGIYRGLKKISNGEININRLAEEVKNTDYSNMGEMKKIVELIENDAQ